MVPLHQSVIWLVPCHHISQSFDLPTATTSSVRASASASTRDRASASTRHRALPYHHISQSFYLPPATTSVSHLICPLPPHQSVIWLAHCHHISQSFDLPTATTSSVRASTRDRASASTRHRALPYHHISQSFYLPTATTSVSHLICPLPPHQSVIWLAHCHHISQSFDLPTATTSSVRTSTRDSASATARHRVLPYHCISQSFDLPTATTSVSHLTCPLSPHQSVIWLALYHYITTLVSHLTCPHHHISQSFDLPPATNQAVIWLAHCHHIISQS